MAKRKATKAELEFGIGEEEVDVEGIDPEDVDDDVFTGFAEEEENDIDDDVLIEEYKKESVNPEESDI